MRQIGVLADEVLARRFADYLLTRKIRAELLPEEDQTGLWVRDEDHLPEAKRELEQFLANPQDPRYTEAESRARNLRRREEDEEKAFEHRQRNFSRRMMLGIGQRPAITLLLVGLSVVLSLLTKFGDNRGGALEQALFIQSVQPVGDGYYLIPRRLTDVWKGQVWRLVTPIFLHFSPMHLVFNMLCMLILGQAIENVRGRFRFLALVLVIAILSNVSQFFYQLSLDRTPWFSWQPSPFFGGMSGVVYGLFGYVWMKQRFEPHLGLGLSTENIIIMLGWLILCAMNLMGPVANTAHLVGLITGMVLGVVALPFRRR